MCSHGGRAVPAPPSTASVPSDGPRPTHDSRGAVSDSHQRIDPSSRPGASVTQDSIAAEIAVEQKLVDRVYAELAKATERASMVEAEGLARGRTDRTGDIRDEEITGLFERDALVFNANKRRTILETQYEGLVFGRLDLGTDRERPDSRRRQGDAICRSPGRARRRVRTAGDRLARAGRRALLPLHAGRADGCPATESAALQRRRRDRHRGRPDGARGTGRPRGRRRRRADGSPHPHARQPDARHRRHHPAPSG